MVMRLGTTALLVTGDVSALVLLPGSAAELLARAAQPRQWLLEVGVDRALAVTAGAAVWLAAAWLGLGLLAAAAARLPGAAGRLGAAVGRCVLPRAVVGVVAGTAGLGVLLAPVGAGADPAPAPTVSAPTWPTSAPTAALTPAPATDPVPAPSWPTVAPTPTPAPARTAAHPAATRAGADAPIRVHAGDSLWLLTGRRLGPGASDAQIAATWPRWYAANRAVIGADPALLQPGQVLHAPAVDREEIR